MRLPALHWLPLLAALAGVLPARAGDLAVTAPSMAGDAKALLARMQGAARERNYHGTMVFAAGAVVSSTRIAHFCVGDQVYERIEALDGRQQRIYRHNGRVQSVWPQTRTVTIEEDDVRAAAALMPELDLRLQEHYELRVIGNERVAGREAVAMWLAPRDEHRFGQRLWADSRTGLMLRADVVEPGGAVLESSAFSDIELDTRPARESVLAPMKKLDGMRVVRITPARTTLEAEGWVARDLPSGFRLVRCERRPVDPSGTDGPAAAGEAVQAIFSDGLTRVSMFIEPIDPDRPRKALLTQLGATTTLMKPRAERWWVTAMGNVPPATLRRFVSGLERRP
jgi:sigma-E factor negative regulatory protein RseB